MVRRIALLFTVLVAAGLSAQAPRDAATVLPVTRVVLYKTGIGYFEHLGSVTGNESLAVQFTGDQLDDVLKSLTAVDLGNGRVVGISYDSPTPAERRLQALRMPLSENATTLQVLDALRGSRVEVRTGAGAVVTGRVLHVERRTRAAGERTEERDELTVITDGGEIATVEIGGATRVRMADADLRQDVGRYLDIAATDGDRSPRRVVLSTVGTGARQILVSYVGEAAVWKTTYRLIFPTAADRQPTLQGWAVVDNMSAADWNNVELSLVAGAPQAFRQPLSAPLFATRPVVPLAAGAGLAPQTHAAALVGGLARIAGTVRDNNRAALPGVTVTVVDQSGRDIGRVVTDGSGRYDLGGLTPGVVSLRAQMPGFSTAQVSSITLPAGGTVQRDLTLSVGALQESIAVSGASPSRGGVAGGISSNFAAAPPPPPPSAALVEQRMLDQSIAASGAELGDLFEYKLTDRVTIRRNQSALVPILQAAVTAERISLWNDAMGARPRRAVWLSNTSKLTLDAGSLSVVDGGAFAGEGLVDTVGPGDRRLVSYAADAGVQVNARAGDSPGRVLRLRIAKGVVTQDSEERQRRTYTIRNSDRDARLVVIEHPARPDWKLAASLKPEESTATVHRFRVTVPPGQTTTLDVDEIKPGATTFAVHQLDREGLLRIAISGAARAEVERALAPVFEKAAELEQIYGEIAKVEGEIGSISNDQARIRENLSALKGSSSERRLVERYTRQLDDQETRLDTLKRERAALAERQARVERERDDLIAAVTLDVTP
ncbi:MAG: carboxypeptidase regulatory-like domain-containing protein [Acidobacteria bacterium]|nr:carboxypeptidase regulatory-like domain-containing protein [Acidobacteriota bacterium]